MSIDSSSLSTDLLVALVRLGRYINELESFRKIKGAVDGVVRRLRGEGLYRVLAYTTVLELMDSKGHKAKLRKWEKVKYLQDNIFAFQDQAWGDGKILIDYDCFPGVAVDRYRLGFKTHILISLREVRSKGDIDNYTVTWKIRDGFLKPTGFWGTEVCHDTDFIRGEVIFPKTRPPKQVFLIEKNRQKTHVLDTEIAKQLPDGKWIIGWELSKPKLHEQYILKWFW